MFQSNDVAYCRKILGEKKNSGENSGENFSLPTKQLIEVCTSMFEGRKLFLLFSPPHVKFSPQNFQSISGR